MQLEIHGDGRWGGSLAVPSWTAERTGLLQPYSSASRHVEVAGPVGPDVVNAGADDLSTHLITANRPGLVAKKAGKVKLKKAMLTVAAGACAVAGSLMAAAPAANATNKVPCSGNSFYEIYGKDAPTDLCFANPGQYQEFQGHTWELNTGNNSGQIYYYNLSDATYHWSVARGHYYQGQFEPPYVNTLDVKLWA